MWSKFSNVLKRGDTEPSSLSLTTDVAQEETRQEVRNGFHSLYTTRILSASVGAHRAGSGPVYHLEPTGFSNQTEQAWALQASIKNLLREGSKRLVS